MSDSVPKWCWNKPLKRQMIPGPSVLSKDPSPISETHWRRSLATLYGRPEIKGESRCINFGAWRSLWGDASLLIAPIHKRPDHSVPFLMAVIPPLHVQRLFLVLFIYIVFIIYISEQALSLGLSSFILEGNSFGGWYELMLACLYKWMTNCGEWMISIVCSKFIFGMWQYLFSVFVNYMGISSYKYE